MSDERVHRLAVRNDLDDVAAVSEWLHDVAKARALPPDLVFRIDLCLAEAVTNVISYAFPDRGTHQIDLELELRPDEAVVTVVDPGRAFNPLEVPEPERPSRLEEAELGGLGVHLIRQYADGCSYERDQDRNVMVMRWRMPDDTVCAH